MLKNTSKKAISLTDIIPEYGVHVTENIVSLDKERLMFILRYEGLVFNTLTTEELERYCNILTRIFSVAGFVNGENLKLDAYFIKKNSDVEDVYEFDNEFMNKFNSNYIKRFKGKEFFEVAYYAAFTLKYHDGLEEAIKDTNLLMNSILNNSDSFNVRPLGIYEKNNSTYTEVGEFITSLCGHSEKVLLSSNKISETIDQGAIHFGYDVAEIRPSNGHKKFATFYDLKNYAPRSVIGQCDFLLNEPSEFIFKQSFSFRSSQQTVKVLKAAINKTSSAKDTPHHLVEEMAQAIPHVQSGDIAFGIYQAGLVVYGDTIKSALEKGNNIVSGFSSKGGAELRKANLTAIDTYSFMFPASKDKLFFTPKTTRNLACGFSLHNYPTGKKKLNPLGDGNAVIPFSTDNNGVYYFNLHDTPVGKDSRTEAAPGHVLTLGSTGSGKTTVESVIINYASRWGGAIFGIDYNESMINNFRGPLRGKYFRIQQGVPTGINPFQWTDTPELRDFLYQLVEILVTNPTAEEKVQIKMAVDTVMDFSDVSNRRLSHVLHTIPDEGGNSLYVRLSEWTVAESGRHAWALDNEVNLFNPYDMYRVAFDTTSLLDAKNITAEPLFFTLFKMKDTMHKNMNGKPMFTMVAEFWAPANYSSTAKEMQKSLNAGRLKGELMMLSSQSPESALKCMIADSVIQQTPTKILLANNSADYASYKAMKISYGDFKIISEMPNRARKMLIKQGNKSNLVSFDLEGFGGFMPIISSSKDSIKEIDNIIEELGTDDPDVWLPIYQERILSKGGL